MSDENDEEVKTETECEKNLKNYKISCRNKVISYTLTCVAIGIIIGLILGKLVF